MIQLLKLIYKSAFRSALDEQRTSDYTKQQNNVLQNRYNILYCWDMYHNGIHCTCMDALMSSFHNKREYYWYQTRIDTQGLPDLITHYSGRINCSLIDYYKISQTTKVFKTEDFNLIELLNLESNKLRLGLVYQYKDNPEYTFVRWIHFSLRNDEIKKENEIQKERRLGASLVLAFFFLIVLPLPFILMCLRRS